MRAPISIIIPTLNAAPQMPDTLARVMEGLNAGVVRELVISDGGSSDDIEALASEVGAQFVRDDAGRGGQLARGAAVAQGDWLLFLHADTWLPEGWSEAALDHIQTQSTALVFSLSFRDKSVMARLTAAWANLRTHMFDLPYGDQALLISRHLYSEIGGHPDQPLMEDVALARALKGRITLSPLCVQTDATRYQTRGWLAQGARNLWCLLRYLAGAHPERLHRGYR